MSAAFRAEDAGRTEVILKGLKLDVVHGWKGKIEGYERYIAGARARATASSEEVQVVWILLTALTASVVPSD